MGESSLLLFTVLVEELGKTRNSTVSYLSFSLVGSSQDGCSSQRLACLKHFRKDTALAGSWCHLYTLDR